MVRFPTSKPKYDFFEDITSLLEMLDSHVAEGEERFTDAHLFGSILEAKPIIQSWNLCSVTNVSVI
jgi:hypothetical protein